MTVGKLSKMFGISRTALLYYDKIGLLSPSARSETGYRLYSDSDIERLRQIFVLRDAGVPLSQIASLVKNEETAVFGSLMKRLGELNLEIEELKNRQKQIIRMLCETDVISSVKAKDAEVFGKILHYAEITQKKKWHDEFEKQSPELHQFLLKVLGINREEVESPKSEEE